MAPAFEDRFRVVTFDLTGSGRSDLSAYDRERHGTCTAMPTTCSRSSTTCKGPVVFVGHSVSAMIGMLAGIKAPERFLAQVMIAPVALLYQRWRLPRRLFPRRHRRAARHDGSELPRLVEQPGAGDHGRAQPAAPGHRTDQQLLPQRSRHRPPFRRVTFLSDHRADVPHATTPALILQCSDDLIAPRSVGDYLHKQLPAAGCSSVENVGHCPHMSAPQECVRLTQAFLDELGLQA
jgi:sigma-B regulation protein RsbQ